jgi:hypothetical protein
MTKDFTGKSNGISRMRRVSRACNPHSLLAFARETAKVGRVTSAEFKELPDATSHSLPLQALWHDAQGNWDEAHALAQKASSRDGDWVHAYLHRKEGDLGNAGYWYARARRPVPSGSLESEWSSLVDELMART